MSTEHDSENLRAVPGFPGYFADREGGIWTTRRRGPRGEQRYREGPLHRLREQKRRYSSVSLYNASGKATCLSVHVVVMLAWVGPRPGGCTQTRHLNGNPHDNRLDNLMWGTPVENAADQKRHGTQVRGERVASSLLTERDVRKILGMLAAGKKHLLIATRFGITEAAVSQIARGKAWKHVTMA